MTAWIIVALLAMIAVELALTARDITTAVAALKDIHYLQSKQLTELQRIRASLPESRNRSVIM